MLVPNGQQKELVERITHFLSKICRNPEAAKQIAESKEVVFKILIYFMAEE